jgi:hypothetical protein
MQQIMPLCLIKMTIETQYIEIQSGFNDEKFIK